MTGWPRAPFVVNHILAEVFGEFTVSFVLRFLGKATEIVPEFQQPVILTISRVAQTHADAEALRFALLRAFALIPVFDGVAHKILKDAVEGMSPDAAAWNCYE
jgi:hypothetical protein